MSKYKIILIILIIIIAVLGSFAFVWSTGLIFPIMSVITNSYCASLGVERLSDHDLNQLQNSSETEIKFLQITDEDLRKMPKLKQVIDKVGNRVEFNTHGRVVLSHDEVAASHTYLSQKFNQQYGFELKQDSFVWIGYGDKIYVIDGFVFITSPYDIELIASQQDAQGIKTIEITNDDFRSIPGIKKAIDEIGTYETSPFSNIGLPEEEQRRYMDWFEEKYEEQYGAQEDGSYSSYFHYNGRYYAPNFSIC